MPSDLKPYPAYKPSGVEWMREIPAHWDVKPIRSLALTGYRTFTDGDWIESPFITADGVRLIQTGNIGIGQYKEQGFRYISEKTFSDFQCTEVRPGDVLICRLANPVGRACLAPDLGYRMITSVDVCILKPRKDVSPEFVVYALSASDYLAFLGAICRGGTRDRVSRSILGAINFRLPPLPEQRAIAHFLDRKTAKIDSLVAKKERLIELLQEKLAALISQAVTKGLDANVPMKDSGVEWLGDMPAHWEVSRVKRIAYIKNGATPSSSVSEYWDGDITWLTPEDLGKLTSPLIDKSVRQITTEGYDSCGTTIAPEGSLAVSTRAPIGHIGVLAVPACVNQGCRLLIPTPVVLPYYLYYTLKTARLELESLGQGSTFTELSRGKLGAFQVPLPPLHEQTAIVEHLDKATAGINAAIDRARRLIELLREYRTSLIAEVVTGKLDVREAAANLPDYAGQ